MNFAYLRHRLSELSAAEVAFATVRVARRALFIGLERVRVRWAEPTAERTIERVAQHYGGQGLYLAEMRTRERPKFFPGVTEMKADHRYFDIGTREALAGAGEDLRARKYTLLGAQVRFGDEIPWAIEPASSWTWPTEEFHIDFLKRLPARLEHADIRRTWELNRLLHIPLLGRISSLSRNDAAWARGEFAAQIDDWIGANPYGYGPNWCSTMDVAIRLINLIWGYHFFRDDGAIPDEFWMRLLRSIWQHAVHVERHPQSADVQDNHHVSHFLGLFYAGMCFPEFEESQRWLSQGRSGLLDQMRLQVYEDGVQHECTTNYQKLVAEMFLHAFLLARYNDQPFPEWFRERLKKMFVVLEALTQPHGLTPVIGDADNGRLQDLATTDSANDYRPLLAAGAIALGRTHCDSVPEAADEPPLELALTLLGQQDPAAVARYPNGSEGPLVKRCDWAFQAGGFYVVRWARSHFSVRGGPFGLRGHGGHSHNDQLSFTHFYDRPLFVDPGMLGYSGLPRALVKYFRSTAAHNTLSVDGIEQLPRPAHSFTGGRHSAYASRETPTVLEAAMGDDTWRLDIEHYYYEQIGIVHRRLFRVQGEGRHWRIEDFVMGQGEREMVWHFHLAPGLEIDQRADGAVITDQGVPIGRLVVEDTRLARAMTVTETPRAEEYGRLHYGHTIRIRLACSVPISAAFSYSCMPFDSTRCLT